MFTSWNPFLDAARLGLEAQRVIVLRLGRIAGGGTAAQAECRHMVSEKVAAAAAAQSAAAAALARGKSIEAAAKLALQPVERAVRANHRRLSRARRLEAMVLPVRRLAKRTAKLLGK